MKLTKDLKKNIGMWFWIASFPCCAPKKVKFPDQNSRDTVQSAYLQSLSGLPAVGVDPDRLRSEYNVMLCKNDEAMRILASSSEETDFHAVRVCRSGKDECEQNRFVEESETFLSSLGGPLEIFIRPCVEDYKVPDNKKSACRPSDNLSVNLAKPTSQLRTLVNSLRYTKTEIQEVCQDILRELRQAESFFNQETDLTLRTMVGKFLQHVNESNCTEVLIDKGMERLDLQAKALIEQRSADVDKQSDSKDETTAKKRRPRSLLKWGESIAFIALGSLGVVLSGMKIRQILNSFRETKELEIKELDARMVELNRQLSWVEAANLNLKLKALLALKLQFPDPSGPQTNPEEKLRHDLEMAERTLIFGNRETGGVEAILDHVKYSYFNVGYSAIEFGLKVPSNLPQALKVELEKLSPQAQKKMIREDARFKDYKIVVTEAPAAYLKTNDKGLASKVQDILDRVARLRTMTDPAAIASEMTKIQELIRSPGLNPRVTGTGLIREDPLLTLSAQLQKTAEQIDFIRQQQIEFRKLAPQGGAEGLNQEIGAVRVRMETFSREKGFQIDTNGNFKKPAEFGQQSSTMSDLGKKKTAAEASKRQVQSELDAPWFMRSSETKLYFGIMATLGGIAIASALELPLAEATSKGGSLEESMQHFSSTYQTGKALRESYAKTLSEINNYCGF